MKYREANLPVRRSLFIGEDLALLFLHTLILPLHWWKLWVVACLSWLQDENTHWKNALQNNIITKYYIQQWNSVAKVMYSLGVIAIQLKCAQAQGPYTLAHTLFNCPCRRDQHIFIIHPLSLSSLAAHHAAIHTVASHLQALCFVWSLFCFPWISLQGAELTDLSDWCIGGGRLVSYCFLHQRSVASITSLICPSYVDTGVSDPLYYREKWVVWQPKNLWVVLCFCLKWRFLEFNFILVCCDFMFMLYFFDPGNFSLYDSISK